MSPYDPTRLAFVERVRWRARRYVLWARHLWAGHGGPWEPDLAITHAEVDRLLQGPDERSTAREQFYALDEAARRMQPDVALADDAAWQDPVWTGLINCFNLSDAEQDLLATILAVEIDPGLQRVYAYLHDDVNAWHATQWLASQLFDWPAAQHCGPDSALTYWRLAGPAEGSLNPWGRLAPWMADPAVVLLALQGTWQDPTLGSAAYAERFINNFDLPCAYPAVLQEIQAFVDAIGRSSRGSIWIDLVGPPGSGKRTLAVQLAASLGRGLLVGDASALLAGQTAEVTADRLIRTLRMARAGGAILYWHSIEGVPASAWQTGCSAPDIVLFSRESPAAAPPEDGIARCTIAVGPLSTAMRERLWRHFSPEPAPRAVRERMLTAGEIASIARTRPAGEPAVQQASRYLVRPPNDLLQLLPCPYTWDDLVLAPDVRRQLQEFEQQARLRWPVYEEWGFERLCPLGKGITALFAGPSGTGKTMAAQVLARSLEVDLYRVDLAGVVNKYIGETEKRLKQVFDHCERADVLLFFDEADALFGQRMQVKDAHDRFANIEIDYLLQRMEQYDGVAVLATNRKNDLDRAFLRRLRFLIDFLPPGPQERLGLWRRALLPRSPSGEPLLEEIDWEFLANGLVLTGADIKSAALGAAFLARADGRKIAMEHVVAAARREMTKHGVVLRATLWEGGDGAQD